MSDGSESPSASGVEEARQLLNQIQNEARLAEEARTGAEASLAAARDAASAVAATRAQVESDQAVVAAKSAHIQDAQDHADGVRASLDRSFTAATSSANEAEGARGRAQAAMTSVDEVLAGVRSSKGQVDSDGAAIAKAKDDADSAVRALNGMAARAVDAEKRVAAYERRLAELEERCQAQLQTITDLLPGATAAGLAYAFDARRKTFLSPAVRWQRWFIGSLFGLGILALTGLVPLLLDASHLTYESLGRAWLARLPFAIALIWLALHAAREAALAQRLEEDYGYKSAVAASFQGFNEQMSKIAEETKPDSPLARLCADTLTTLAAPPGRIYEKHPLTATPLDKIKDALEDVLVRRDKTKSTEA